MLARWWWILVMLSLPAAGQEYKIAVVGLVHSHVWGHIGKMVSGKPARLVGVAETIPELVKEAQKRGVSEDLIFTDYRKMLDQTKPDIVWAFVENNRHLEVAQECAARRIHVMFEKPLAATLKEAQAIQRLAQKTGIKVMTNYQMAWWPTQYAARQKAASGALGEIWRIRGIVGHGGLNPVGVNKYFADWLFDPVKNGGGALMDFGCYNALWALWYLGRPETVFATALRLRPLEYPKVEDHATMILTYKNAQGVFEGSWDLPRSFQDLEVFGRKGSIYVTRDNVQMQIGRESVTVELPGLPAERAEPIAYMVHCIRNNQPVEGLTALDINVEVVEIIEAFKQSIATGRAVRLRGPGR